jgi:hypothetical protein
MNKIPTLTDLYLQYCKRSTAQEQLFLPPDIKMGVIHELIPMRRKLESHYYSSVFTMKIIFDICVALQNFVKSEKSENKSLFVPSFGGIDGKIVTDGAAPTLSSIDLFVFCFCSNKMMLM